MTPHDFGFARSITLALPACVLCLCYLLILARARREITRPALLLRALAALCATLAFLAPYYNASTTTRATILLLLDDSQSLARKLDTRTVQQDVSNLAALLQRRARQYNAPMTLATLSGQTLRSLEDYSSAKLQETRSPIASALTYCQAERYGAVVLLSDGIAQPATSTQSLRAPHPHAAPLYAVALGNSQPAFDCALQSLNWNSQDDATRDLVAQIAVANDRPHSVQNLTLVLWRFTPSVNTGKDWRVEPLTQRRVELTCDADGNATLSVNLENLPNPPNGAFDCLVLLPATIESNASVTPQIWAQMIRSACQSEASSVNNVAILPPQAPRAIKAIILEEEPRSEFRYLRQTLRRLPNLTLTTVLFSADPRVSQNDPEALAIQELPNLKLDDYDVIVLGRLSHNSARLLEEPLKALMANDDNSTALWLLHDAYRADDHSAWRPMEELLPSALAREPLPTRHNNSTWRWEIPQGARAIYGDVFCQRLRDAHGVDARPHDTRPATHAATQVILQICDEDQTSEPVLMLAQLNRHKIAWQARQELWPMQTLAEKDLYPEFIAKTLDFLTEDSIRTHVATYPPGGDSNQETTDINISPQVIDFPEDISEYLTVDSSRRERIAEQLDLAASSALLEETALLTNGKTLDLRDRNEEETLELASDFFEEILKKLPQHTTQTPRRLLPPDLSAILLLALILASWFMEKNAISNARNLDKKD